MPNQIYVISVSLVLYGKASTDQCVLNLKPGKFDLERRLAISLDVLRGGDKKPRLE